MRIWRVLIVLAACSTGCVSGPQSSDSRTTWLSGCEVDQDCDATLSCLCGVCSEPCKGAEDCSSPDAVCRGGAVVGECESRSTQICTLACQSSAECPFDLECNAGSCRQMRANAPQPASEAGESMAQETEAVTVPDAGSDNEMATTPTAPSEPSGMVEPSGSSDPDGSGSDEQGPSVSQRTAEEPQTTTVEDSGSSEPDPSASETNSAVPPLDTTALPSIDLLGGSLCAEDVPAFPEVGPIDCGGVCPEDLAKCNAASHDPIVDAYFLAAVELQQRASSLREASEFWLGQMVTSLTGVTPLSVESAQGELETLATAGLDEVYSGPLQYLLAGDECGVSASSLVASAAQCDTQLEPADEQIDCQGTCLAEAQAMTSCEGSLSCDDDADAAFCEGLCSGICALQISAQCGGACTGHCELEAQVCPGTCLGEVNGELCTGECQLAAVLTCPGSCDECQLVEGRCDGTCSGSCEHVPAEGGCVGATLCQSSASDAVACSGWCQGDASLASRNLEAACEASVAVQAALLQRCLPTSALTLAQGSVAGADAAALEESFACFTDATTHLAQIAALADSAIRAGNQLTVSESLIGERAAALAEATSATCAGALLPEATQRVAVALQDLQLTATTAAAALSTLQ